MPWTELFDREAQRRLPGMTVLREEPLSGRTSFRIGGPVRRLACPRSMEECTALLELSRELSLRVILLGNGSNILAADEGMDALAVAMGGIRHLSSGEAADGNRLTAGAGVTLARLSEYAAARGLTGLEFAQGIPGTVGGGLMMNAGAYGGELAQTVEQADVWFPGEGVKTLSRKEMAFGYRRSVLGDRPQAAALQAVFRLEKGNPEEIRARMREYAAKRREKQPLEFPSAGSTFKRPPGQYAGALIDQCGLRGASVGGAQVSEKHAGFIINTGGAACRDVLALIEQVQQTVAEQTGFRLEPEVKILR